MEKPLLVSGPLINPVKKRRKTETRRLRGLDKFNQNPDGWHCYPPGSGFPECDEKGRLLWYFTQDHVNWEKVTSPYGEIGDTLWVRENWYVGAGYDDVKPIQLPRAKNVKRGYMADGEKPEWAGKTRPSIHMPRWLSRIELEIEDIRLERLHDITEESARREGVTVVGSAVISFNTLWQSLNGPDNWALNPWIWVIKFTLKTP